MELLFAMFALPFVLGVSKGYGKRPYYRRRRRRW